MLSTIYIVNPQNPEIDDRVRKFVNTRRLVQRNMNIYIVLSHIFEYGKRKLCNIIFGNENKYIAVVQIYFADEGVLIKNLCQT